MAQVVVNRPHSSDPGASPATGGDAATGPRIGFTVPALPRGPADTRLGSILDPRPELPRPLLDSERQILTAVLGFADFTGRDELRAQAADAEVVGYCGCGCASVRLRVGVDAAPAPRQPGPIPVYAVVLDTRHHSIGRIVVYVAAPGRLWLLEIAGRDAPIRSLLAAGELLFRCVSTRGRR